MLLSLSNNFNIIDDNSSLILIVILYILIVLSISLIFYAIYIFNKKNINIGNIFSNGKNYSH